MAHHSIIFCLLAVLAVLPGAARAAACPSGAQPEIRMNTALPSPNIRHVLRRSQIGALGGHGHMTSDRSHAGLTQAKTKFLVRPTLAFSRMADGGICATLKSVEVTWRMEQFQVDVAADYRRDSCPYREILRHENQHVDIFQRAFIAAERALRRDLSDLARRTTPFRVRGGDMQRAAEEVSRNFMAAARPSLETYNRDAGRENGAIDTPESYRAVAARCRDW